MTPGAGTRASVGSAVRLAAIAIALTLVVAAASAWLSDGFRATPSRSASGEPAGTPAPPTVQLRCAPETGSLPLALRSDPCPSARLAVELAVAPVRRPIDVIVIEAGNFGCGLFWPGAQTPPPCYGGATRPGQYMHAWVSFTGTAEVAVVVLGLNLPDDLDAPGATRPPWHTTLLAVEVPPPGWVMP